VQPSISLVTVNYGVPVLVRRLLTSLAGHPDRALLREVIVVDNGFPDAGDSRVGLGNFDIGLPVRFVQNGARGYSSGINAGAANASGDILALSNNDVEWLPGFGIGPLVSVLAQREDAGIAGPQLVFPDGSWQRSFGLLPSIAEGSSGLFLYEIVRNAIAAARFRRGRAVPAPSRVGYVDGAFMLVRRACFEALGGFETALTFYGEDVDFCWRAARAGYQSVFVPEARVMHVRGASSTTVASADYLARMHVARIGFVALRHGPIAAKLYQRLLQLSTWEVALVHAAAWCVRPTTRQRRRLGVALATARAAMNLALPSIAGTD